VRIRIDHAGQRHLDVGELHTEDRAAASDDVDLVAIERQVALDRLDARPAARIVEHRARDPGRDLELSFGWIEEREIAQIASQTKAPVAHLTLEHPVRYPLAGARTHDRGERQVARGAFAVGAR
jgi:hypothetical protein